MERKAWLELKKLRSILDECDVEPDLKSDVKKLRDRLHDVDEYPDETILYICSKIRQTYEALRELGPLKH